MFSQTHGPSLVAAGTARCGRAAAVFGWSQWSLPPWHLPQPTFFPADGWYRQRSPPCHVPSAGDEPPTFPRHLPSATSTSNRSWPLFHPLQPLQPGSRGSYSSPRIFPQRNFLIHNPHRFSWSLPQKGCRLAAPGIVLCRNPGDHFSAEDTKL